jgi:hypothetical protein
MFFAPLAVANAGACFGCVAAAERLISVITNAVTKSVLFTMFLLWVLRPTTTTRNDFTLGKIARRVYAVTLPNAMEKKVPTL